MKETLRLPRQNLVVYGLGGAFHWFHEIFMHRLGYRPSFLVDAAAQDGDYFEGIPVVSEISSIIEVARRHQYTVVICTGKWQVFQKIRERLSQQGFKKIIWIHALYEIHDPFGLSQGVFNETAAPDQAEKIENARSLLKDAQSVEIFDRLIQMHRTKNPISIAQSPAESQYFPGDIEGVIQLNRIAMCGGDCDALISLSRLIKEPIDQCVIFEPDYRAFQKFSDRKNIFNWVGDISNVTKSLVVLPCAVSSKSCIAPFVSSFTSFGSRLHPDGKEFVQCVKLDHIFHNLYPTYICMDIEGEELNAIHGAREIIQRSQTSLAISVYHKASHLWEIPNLIHTINQDYNFQLRNYTGFAAETILYAIAK